MRSICQPANGVRALVLAAVAMGLAACSTSEPDLVLGEDFSDSLLQLKTTFTEDDPQLFGEIAFVWDEIAGATHYRFYADADGDSDGDGDFEFVQIGPDIPTGTDPLQASIAISVHLFDWERARFRLDWCDAAGCTEAGQQVVAFLSQLFISPLINAGTSLAYAEDGATLAVGAPRTSFFACETLIPVETVANECEYDETLTLEEAEALGLQETIAFGGSVGVFTFAAGIWNLQAILKASNIEEGDGFGSAVAISDDGNVLAVAAVGEDSNATGIDGDEANNDAAESGAVYVFVRTDLGGGDYEWNQVAYIKASNTEGDPDPDDLILGGDGFGSLVALSADGTVLGVAAPREDSIAMGIDGDDTDNSAEDSGAVFVFRDFSGTWMQDAYIKASNTDAGDSFGTALAINSAGDRLAVSAQLESSASAGIDGDAFNNSAAGSGAVYVFDYGGSAWAQQSYIKAAVPDAGDEFGFSLDLNAAGDILAVGAIKEDGAARGVNAVQADNNSVNTGAVYLFEDMAGTWSQSAFFRASNADPVDQFGFIVTLNSTGDLLLGTSVWEGGRSQGINGSEVLDNFVGAGAAYLFVNDTTGWEQKSYIKSTVNAPNINFGLDAAMALDGLRLVISDLTNSTVYTF